MVRVRIRDRIMIRIIGVISQLGSLPIIHPDPDPWLWLRLGEGRTILRMTLDL